jgi:serine-type D-Ala-D-Ala carboxypeptidase/endopeptidase (penicillin-binding protein 4)
LPGAKYLKMGVCFGGEAPQISGLILYIRCQVPWLPLFMRLLLVVFSLLFLSGCSVSRFVRRELRQSPVLSRHPYGLAVYDPARQRMLAAHQSDRYFVPASNVKLLTLYAGMQVLGDSLPGLQYQLRGDSLVFRGTGDPSLLHPDLPASAVLDFLRSRPEQLYFTGNNFQDGRFGPGWAWDDYNDYYQAERSPLPVYGNVVRFSADSAGRLSLSPALWTDSLRVVPGQRGIRRDEDRNLFRRAPDPLPAGRRQDVPVRMSHPLTADLLTGELGRPVRLLTEVPAEVPWQTVYSLPADSLYTRMLQQSDNMLAEQLLLLYASALGLPLSSSGAIAHALDNHLQDLPDRPVWRDGSGLSRYNLITPRSLVQVLDRLYAQVPRERLFAMLARGGRTGTLRNMFKGDETYVFAKSGSLSNIYCLSGYLQTRKGKTLVFSFMNNNFPGPVTDLRKEVERILTRLHERY